MLFPYWVSPPWPCLGFGPRPGIRGVSCRCLASCLFLVVLLGVVSRLDYGVPAASGLGQGLLLLSWVWVCPVRVASWSCSCPGLSLHFVRSWVVLGRVASCLPLRLRLRGRSLHCSLWLSRLVSPYWLAAGSLLARCWLAAVSHAELYDSVQRNRVRRCWAVVSFAPSTRLLLPGSVWIVLGFCPPCLDHTRYLVETRPVPGSSWSVSSGRVPFSPSLSSLVLLSSWLALPLHPLPHPGRLDLSPSGSLGFC